MSHWPTLVFKDEHGDLVRCDCGEQGFDFKHGREWFAEHLAALDRSDPAVGLDVGPGKPFIWSCPECGTEVTTIIREPAGLREAGTHGRIDAVLRTTLPAWGVPEHVIDLTANRVYDALAVTPTASPTEDSDGS